MIPKIVFNKPTFLTCNFDEPVLYAPARVNQYSPSNILKIITGFTDCERISTHMIALSDGMKCNHFVKGLKVEIILGMTKSSLSAKKHQDICRLIDVINSSSGMPELSLRYICNGPEVHSKVYVWSYFDKGMLIPTTAYSGSLNYTMNAFYKRRENVSMCNSLEALYYYQNLLQDTIDCLDPNVPVMLKNVINNAPSAVDAVEAYEKDYNEYDRELPVGTINVSLLKADGSDTGYGSGVNWGIRPNGTRRNFDQAYIPYNSQDRVYGFFPDRQSPTDINCPIFKVITKDFGSFHMRMAQDGNKALECAENNAIIGLWLRRRLGIPSGAMITKQMLINYGRTDVTFRKYSDGTYLLDF